MEIKIKDMGAVPDGKTINTVIIQQAIDMCAESGGRVVISDGVYLTGKLTMKSNVELHISAGGVLLASPDYSDYPEANDLTHVDSKMLPRNRNTCLIFAECCKNISITGMGTIDCNGGYFVEPIEVKEKHRWTYQRIAKPTPPRVVFFTGCDNVKIQDVTMINQPAGWSYWIHDCAYVSFDKVKIFADVHYPNNDGIHINCSHDISITNCFITCGDDCIVVRANSASLKENKPCEKICVSNCTLTSYTNAVRIGWMNDGKIRNCVFSNITVTDSRLGISIYLPFRIRKNENIRIFNEKKPISTDIGREETHIENILFDTIIMSGIYSKPIMIEIDPNDEVLCKCIDNIRFSNVHATALQYPHFKGRPSTPLGDIYFYNCSFIHKDEIDGEKSPHTEMVREYADKIHFINTEFHES